MGTFRRILHASDFSTASRPAFRQAVELTKAGRGSLLIAHVLASLPIMADAYVAATTYDELLRGQRAAAKKQLDRLVANARAAGVRASGILVEFGVPAERIARLARSKRADLIVMGTHGRTGFKRAVLGSVAGRVLALASCPVLTVRGR
ncbi:MAG TPA: universal stress protein [Methylomirabilota bacterium]|jgi:nucleotide-binding universal stress UspA family protein